MTVDFQRRYIYLLILFVLLLIMPFAVRNSFVDTMLTLTFIWTIAAMGWNLTNLTGLVSFGHTTAFGLGGLVSLLLFIDLGLSPWIGMVLGALFGMIVLTAFAIPSVKLSPVAFAFATLTLPLILIEVIMYLGYLEVPVPLGTSLLNFQFASPIPYYLISVFIMFGSLLFMMWVGGSKVGLYFKAVKSDEEGARASGINTIRYKLFSVALGAFFSGIAGTLYVQFVSIFTPDSAFGFTTIVQLIIVSVIGGAGTIWGPIVGGFILVPLAQIIQLFIGSAVPGAYLIVYGLLMIVVMGFIPAGIYPTIRNLISGESGT